MNSKPDRTMIYIGISVLLLVGAIAITSIINNKASSGTDIRARASSQSGLQYHGTVSSVDYGNRSIALDGLKPLNGGMNLSGTWTAQVPQDVVMDNVVEGATIKVVVDSKSFSIANKTMGIKKLDIK